MFNVNHRDLTKRSEIYLKLLFNVFLVNFEQISYIVLVFTFDFELLSIFINHNLKMINDNLIFLINNDLIFTPGLIMKRTFFDLDMF